MVQLLKPKTNLVSNTVPVYTFQWKKKYNNKSMLKAKTRSTENEGLEKGEKRYREKRKRLYYPYSSEIYGNLNQKWQRWWLEFIDQFEKYC